MGGVGLGRLWSSHPRVAFVLHLMATLMFGGFVVSLIYSGAGWVSVLVIAIGFVLMAGTLVFFTWFAINDRWQPDEYSTSYASSRLPGLGAAWQSAQTRERILWSLFALVFLIGLSLLSFERSVVGLALVVLSIAVVVAAVKAGK